MVEEKSVGTSREAGMATIRDAKRNWKFHQQMHRRARELARIADLRAVLGPSYLTPAWAPYTNPLLREMERTRQSMEAVKSFFPQPSSGWSDLIQKATAQFDPGKIDVPEPDTDTDTDTGLTLRIEWAVRELMSVPDLVTASC